MTDAEAITAETAGGKVIRGSALRIAASVAGLMVGVVTAPLVIRYLGPTEFGRLAVVQSLITIVLALTEGGLGSVATRAYALAGKRDRDRLVRNLLGLRIVLVGVGTIGAVAYAASAGFDRTLLLGTAISMAGLLATTYQNALMTPLAVGLRLGAAGATDLLRASVAGVSQVTLVLLGASLLPFYATIGVASIVTLVFTAYLVRSDVVPLPRFDRDVWGHLLRETGVFAVATALGALYFQIALQGLKLISDAREVGDYSVAFRVIEIGNSLPWLVAGAVFPIFSHAAVHDLDRFQHVLSRALDSVVLIGFGISLGLAVGAGIAIDYIGGSAAGRSIDILRLLAVAVPATYLVAVGSFALLALRATRSILACNLVAVCFALVMTHILVASHGARGAAVVTIGVEWLLAIAYLIALRRIDASYGIRSSVLSRLACILAVSVGAALGLQSVEAPAVALLGAAMVLFGLGSVFSGLVPKEVSQAVRERFEMSSREDRRPPR